MNAPYVQIRNPPFPLGNRLLFLALRQLNGASRILKFDVPLDLEKDFPCLRWLGCHDTVLCSPPSPGPCGRVPILAALASLRAPILHGPRLLLKPTDNPTYVGRTIDSDILLTKAPSSGHDSDGALDSQVGIFSIWFNRLFEKVEDLWGLVH